MSGPYVGLNSFGGPAGQIAVMHRVLVDTRRWVSEQRFLHALNYCMLLPGPEAHQLSVYIGWLMHGIRGGLLRGRLAGALTAITAALVGAILNLAVWFGLHAIFGVVDTVQVGPLRLEVPELTTLDPAALVIAVLASVAVFRWRWPTLPVLAAAAVIGSVWYLWQG